MAPDYRQQLEEEIKAIISLCQDCRQSILIQRHNPDRLESIEIVLSCDDNRPIPDANALCHIIRICLRALIECLEWIQLFIQLEPYAPHERLLLIVRDAWKKYAALLKSRYDENDEAVWYKLVDLDLEFRPQAKSVQQLILDYDWKYIIDREGRRLESASEHKETTGWS